MSTEIILTFAVIGPARVIQEREMTETHDTLPDSMRSTTGRHEQCPAT